MFSPPLVLVWILLFGMEQQQALRKVVIMRHGRTNYLHGNKKFTSSENSPDDLIIDSLDTVKETGRAISLTGPIRRILSSPTARCLHTARVMREAAGLNALPIEIEEELREIDNYNRIKFLRAVNEIHGDHKKLSDLELSEIFVKDDLHKKFDGTLSKETREFLASLEKSSDAKARAFKLLQSMKGGEVLVTHDGVACQFLPLSSKNVTLTRGKYLVLQEGPAGEWKISETNDESIKLN